MHMTSIALHQINIFENISHPTMSLVPFSFKLSYQHSNENAIILLRGRGRERESERERVYNNNNNNNYFIKTSPFLAFVPVLRSP